MLPLRVLAQLAHCATPGFASRQSLAGERTSEPAGPGLTAPFTAKAARPAYEGLAKLLAKLLAWTGAGDRRMVGVMVRRQNQGARGVQRGRSHCRASAA
jgi:hypothetical protein